MRAPCGYYKSKKGKPFTQVTIRDHIRNCSSCQSIVKVVEDEAEFPLYDLIADEDWSDGAYWALAHELKEL